MKRPLGAQISHMLKDRGVDTIFGIPGVHNVEMYRGIEEAGITHVLARHEQGAGFMADGYARATGKPGVAYVITGPGLCNIMTPMGQAYSDSVPMLVISSCLDEVAAKKGQLHQMKDQRAAAETVCDWSEEARTAEAAYQLVDRAFAEFAAERERPKHIQVGIEVLGATAEAYEARYGHGPHSEACDLRDPRKADVEQCANSLRKAKKPLFVFGGGAKPSTKAARQLMAMVGAASFTTYAGRGVIHGDPLHFGASVSRPDTEEVFKQADLVFFIGTDCAEVDFWRDHPGHDCDAVIVNIDAEVLAKKWKVTDTVVKCGSAEFITSLGAHFLDHQVTAEWNEKDVAKKRAKWRMDVDSERPDIVPICDALRQCLPEQTRVFSDMTQFAYVAKDVWDMEAPNLWHHPYGFGTLGYALPAAIGGKIGLGVAPVIAIAGDYGFQYTVQELGVAVELGLNLPIIVWDNQKLKEIEDCMVNSQIAPNAVQALNPDFCKLAEAWGALSAHPKTLDEMQAAVRDAFAADGPTLIYLTPDILG